MPWRVQAPACSQQPAKLGGASQPWGTGRGRTVHEHEHEHEHEMCWLSAHGMFCFYKISSQLTNALGRHMEPSGDATCVRREMNRLVLRSKRYLHMLEACLDAEIPARSMGTGTAHPCPHKLQTAIPLASPIWR